MLPSPMPTPCSDAILILWEPQQFPKPTPRQDHYARSGASSYARSSELIPRLQLLSTLIAHHLQELHIS
jgi:hypothetical protein